MKSVRLCAVAVLLAVVLALSSAQVEASPAIVFSDAEDGGVDSTGGYASNIQSIWVCDDYLNHYNRLFVKFSLAGISGTLSSATLHLYLLLSLHDGPPVDDTSPLTNPGLGDLVVRHINDYGTLDSSDLNAPSIGNDPGVLLSSSATPDVGYVSINVRAAMQDDIDNGRSFSSFMLNMTTNTDNDGAADGWLFLASEYAGTEYDPYIGYAIGAAPHSVFEFRQDVLNATSNTAWYVLGDYVLHRNDGTKFRDSDVKHSPVVAAIATDIFAAQYLMGGSSNPQNAILDTNSAYISQADGDFGNATIDGPIVTVGGPLVSETVYYYMYTSNETQLFWDSGAGAIKRRDTGATVTSETSNATKDFFVVESFVDSQGRVVYMFWGRGARGTMAATCFMMEVLLKPSNPYGDTSWFVVRWNEASSGPSVNSFPDAGDTYTVLASGPSLP